MYTSCVLFSPFFGFSNTCSYKKKKNYGIVWLVDILFVFHMEGENVIKELVSLSSKVERSDHHRNSK